jgi:hypothetical protein
MQHQHFSKAGDAATYLSAKTGETWTPQLVLERLTALLSGPCDGLELDSVFVLLPDGCELVDNVTGERTVLEQPELAEVLDADVFLRRLASFADPDSAAARPLALVIDGRHLRAGQPVFATQLRLVPRDLRSLANMPEPASLTPFHDLVAEMRAGLHPRLSEQLFVDECGTSCAEPSSVVVPRSTDSYAAEKRKRVDNLQRAIEAALAILPLGATASEVFDYLASGKDETGYVHGRDADEITWENISGQFSRTTRTAFFKRFARSR